MIAHSAVYDAPGRSTRLLSPIPAIPEEQLAQLVAELIEPESWKSRKDVYLRAVPGRLLIRHTEAVHRQVQELFTHLGVRAWPLSASAAATLGRHDTIMSSNGNPVGVASSGGAD